MNYKKYESFMLEQQRYRINELQETITLQEQVIDKQNTLIQRMNERIEEADEAIKQYQVKALRKIVNDFTSGERYVQLKNYYCRCLEIKNSEIRKLKLARANASLVTMRKKYTSPELVWA